MFEEPSNGSIKTTYLLSFFVSAFYGDKIIFFLAGDSADNFTVCKRVFMKTHLQNI